MRQRPIAFLAWAVLAVPAGGGSHCDPALVSESKNPMSYRLRGNRCEGIYAQEVSSVSLDIRSLVKTPGLFDPSREPAVVLKWKAPPASVRPVRVRAFSLKDREYFRMDTAVPANYGGYRWPTEIVASVGLKREEIGLVAWTTLPGPGGSAREVYLPLHAGRAAAAKPGYQVAIVPSARLKEVRITLSRLDDRGSVAEVLRRDEELGFGFYPSGKPIEFPTGKLGETGFYRLEIAVKPVSGPPVKEDVELYHAENLKEGKREERKAVPDGDRAPRSGLAGGR
ncbi:MAG TPA: hypothetical protein VLE27_06230 [Thermoanaerobaculia bacterium]|nr:hypothetical protein [Thermoanaerobaculia bacterium]